MTTVGVKGLSSQLQRNRGFLLSWCSKKAKRVCHVETKKGGEVEKERKMGSRKKAREGKIRLHTYNF